MSDEFEQQDWVKVGVAATLAKEYAADQRNLLELLALMLESSLPGEAEIERKGGLFSKKTVHRIRVQVGDDRYTLEDPGRGPLQASKTRVVRGIALKTEPISVEEWINALSAEMETKAKSHAEARAALAKFVG